MVEAVIASGTDDIGRRIAEGLLKTKKHEILILSCRTSCPEREGFGVRIIAFSYHDPTSLVDALSSVHTVISTICGVGKRSTGTTQLMLLDISIKRG